MTEIESKDDAEDETNDFIEEPSKCKTKNRTNSAKIRAKLTWTYVSTLILPAIDEGTDIWSSIKHFM